MTPKKAAGAKYWLGAMYTAPSSHSGCENGNPAHHADDRPFGGVDPNPRLRMSGVPPYRTAQAWLITAMRLAGWSSVSLKTRPYNASTPSVENIPW